MASARLVRLSRGRGTAGAQDKESKFSILRRSRTVRSIIHTSENSYTTCFLCTHSMGLFAAPFRNVGLAPLDRPQVDFQQGPAERSARSLRAADFFFFEACFAKTVETPSPPNARSSFRKLLRTFATAPKLLRFFPYALLHCIFLFLCFSRSSCFLVTLDTLRLIHTKHRHRHRT